MPDNADNGFCLLRIKVHGAVLATRDGADFSDIGVELINPWNL
jgi:hypothetical protein